MNLRQAGAIALGVWAACGAAAAAESFVLYDDFSSSKLNPARWADGERTRVVSNSALRLAQRDWGVTANDVGTQAVSWSDTIARSGPVTQVAAQVKVTDLEVTACAANASPTFVRARVLGTFFNSGNRSAGSNVGDVFAQLYVARFSNSADAPGVLRVEGNVQMCTSSDCNQSTQIGSTVSLGTVNMGTAIVLQIDWDRANKQFLFSRDKGATTAVGYSVDDSADPGSVWKAIGTRTNAANCASGPRTTAFIDAKFDNVQVNKTAKP